MLPALDHRRRSSASTATAPLTFFDRSADAYAYPLDVTSPYGDVDMGDMDDMVAYEEMSGGEYGYGGELPGEYGYGGELPGDYGYGGDEEPPFGGEAPPASNTRTGESTPITVEPAGALVRSSRCGWHRWMVTKRLNCLIPQLSCM